MKCLKFIVLLSLAALVAGGGETHCGNLPEFMALYQACVIRANKIITSVYDTLAIYPAYAHTLATCFQCSIDLVFQLFANGTSQLTGVDMDFILGIFNRTILPPLTSPLDCIQNELLAFSAFSDNITQNIIPEWHSMYQNTSIDANTPCANVSAIANFYYQGTIIFTHRRINDSIADAKNFESIGQLPLLSSMTDKIYECGRTCLTVNMISGILNVELSQVEAFFQNDSLVIGPPLSCIKDMIKNLKIFADNSQNDLNGISNPNCGMLPSTFNVLVGAVKDNIDRVLAAIEDVIHIYPALTNSFITYYECYLKISYNILANGTSQFSGIDIDYIHGIFNGTILPAFVAPFGCIQNELLEFNAYANNISQTIIPAFQALKVSTAITASTPCVNVTQTSNFYYQAVLAFSTQRVNDTLENAAIFNNIGRLNLLLAEISEIYDCGHQIAINGISEILNIDPSITASFLQDPTISIGSPLSCVASIVTSINKTVQISIDSSTTSITTNPRLSCDPPFGEFRAFKNAWHRNIMQLQEFASSCAFNHSILTSFYISDFNCQLDIMTLLAANYTNILTGVDSEIVYQILTTNISEPFAAPLDCIAVDLLFMRQLISTYRNIIIPGLMNYATTSNANVTTCRSAYAELANYIPILVEFFYAKEPLITEATAAFNTLGLADLYLDSIGAASSCTPANLGAFVGAVLHSNGTSVANLMSGKSMTLPYPFICVRSIISILDNVNSRALIDFVIGDPLTLTNPTVPPYNG